MAEARRADAEAWSQADHGPGRPPSFKARIDAADTHKRATDQALETARARQEGAASPIRDVGTTYHSVDLGTGVLQRAGQVSAMRERHFAEIRAVADEAALPEPCHQGVRRAHRLVPALAATIFLFHGHAQHRLDALGPALNEWQATEAQLLPAAYLDRAARKAATAEIRTTLRDLANRLRRDCRAAVGALSADRFAAIDAVVQSCAVQLQRSSSCVEACHGQLSLRHHSLPDISSKRLQPLATVHNYFIGCPHRSTAARRVFGAPHTDLFACVLDRVAMPARPAASGTLRAPVSTAPAPLLC